MGKVRKGKGFRERESPAPCRRPCLRFPSLSAYVAHTPLVVPVITHADRLCPVYGTGPVLSPLGTGIRTLADVVCFLLGIAAPADGPSRTFSFQIL